MRQNFWVKTDSQFTLQQGAKNILKSEVNMQGGDKT
jgi:hypothetical protein